MISRASEHPTWVGGWPWSNGILSHAEQQFSGPVAGWGRAGGVHVGLGGSGGSGVGLGSGWGLLPLVGCHCFVAIGLQREFMHCAVAIAIALLPCDPTFKITTKNAPIPNSESVAIFGSMDEVAGDFASEDEPSIAGDDDGAHRAPPLPAA